MNIGQASRAANLPAKTIRYYEDIGLIHPVRNANGYRDFSENDLHSLHFLARARSLGFSIEECRDLLDLYADRERASADVKAIAGNHLRQISEKIAELEAMQTTLQQLIDKCHGDNRPECPILRDLAQSR
jgi:Cu(I)-responsive transcriptional regulator